MRMSGMACGAIGAGGSCDASPGIGARGWAIACWPKSHWASTNTDIVQNIRDFIWPAYGFINELSGQKFQLGVRFSISLYAL
jgi:hypothetical protein